MTAKSEYAGTLNRALRANLLDEVDSAVIFQDLDYLAARLQVLVDCFPKTTRHSVAIKTNPLLPVLKWLTRQGVGLEAASFEEVRRALSVGADPESVVFDSPVKTRKELAQCASQIPGAIVNANSLEEIVRHAYDPPYRLGLRVNPLIDVGAPGMFSVSGENSKFGVPIEKREEILRVAKKHFLRGLHVHVASEIGNLESHVEAIGCVVDLALETRQLDGGTPAYDGLEFVDIGGGLPSHAGEAGLSEFVAALSLRCPTLFSEFEVITEFGRWVHAGGGFTASRVEYVRRNVGGSDLVFLHVGADLFPREVYAQSRSLEFVVTDRDGCPRESKPQMCSLAGPLCFAGDFLAIDVLLPRIEEGDFVIVLETGANTHGLWSRHCNRDFPKVIGICDGNLDILQERIAIPL